MDNAGSTALDFFKRESITGEWLSGFCLGRPIYIDYDKAAVSISDKEKIQAGGVPNGSFLLAYATGSGGIPQALLLRVMRALEKGNGGANGADQTAVECRVLGTIYPDKAKGTCFGSDVGDLLSPSNYILVKPSPEYVEAIANFRYGNALQLSGVKVGNLRYGSSLNYAAADSVEVYVNPRDFLGKRTALFGMTRTGKSNTVKKIIQATMNMSAMAKGSIPQAAPGAALTPFDAEGAPNYPVGQVIFDINGEYANANMQDEGTAIFEMYKDMVTRYSVAQKRDFKVMDELRSGRIIIIDLSQGDPESQVLYSERITRQIFTDAMSRFVENKPNNFIQFYFEEAHNLFPRNTDANQVTIYNRLAKEGAKLNLGLVYLTQEVSSISSNILKNTQNWFIAHLNNTDEIHEIQKYYDFGDFTDSLLRFSPANDIGFCRMKTYSNPFTIPVQISRFSANAEN
jgi:DNA helicase HerA-like ATPase